MHRDVWLTVHRRNTIAFTPKVSLRKTWMHSFQNSKLLIPNIASHLTTYRAKKSSADNQVMGKAIEKNIAKDDNAELTPSVAPSLAEPAMPQPHLIMASGRPSSRDQNECGSCVLTRLVKDENLKKLLMSWYYAGYYTGLYEGQQQAQQPPPSQS